MISDGPSYDSASMNACAVCAILAPNATVATYTWPYMFASRPSPSCRRLARGGELGRGAERRRLRRLPPVFE
jgi:hypothetical protein